MGDVEETIYAVEEDDDGEELFKVNYLIKNRLHVPNKKQANNYL